MTAVLFVGGTRSGKSRLAERRAATLGGPVTYVACGGPPVDADHAARIAAHRLRRPPEWRTVEADEHLPDLLGRLEGTVLVDSVGGWVTACGLTPDPGALARAVAGRTDDTVIVAEEVGSAVHPLTAAGRRFVDAVGDCTRQLAAVCDEVLWVVAGRIVALREPEW